MYKLSTPIQTVRGVGDMLATRLAEYGISTVLDLLLQLPLHYRDYSQFAQIATLTPKDTVTIQAEVLKVNRIFKSRRPMTTVVVADESGKTTLYWFNNKFVANTLKVGETYLFSGAVSDRKTLVQPSFERITTEESIHTGRLVPQYTRSIDVAQGTLRRILKGIIDNLDAEDRSDLLSQLSPDIPPRSEALKQLHFPETDDKVIAARERLALEELLGLIRYSQSIKEEWASENSGVAISQSEPVVPDTVPFELTAAQHRVITEILQDIQKSAPMNRLLQGDVGSGKTVVAGVAALQTLRGGNHAALIAPTKILAEQHFQTISKLFPSMPLSLVVSGKKNFPDPDKPFLWIGTHALINKLPLLKPGLVIYDEQQRFGVAQRSQVQELTPRPHLLTMTATPIPRTLLLTLFSHLSLSVIDQLPANRMPTKTWYLPEAKREGMYEWLKKEIEESNHTFQALIVCPFIDPSEAPEFEKVACATEMFAKITKEFKKVATVGLLHGRQSIAEKAAVTEKLFAGKLDILVTTPIVEVGIDLPQASAMIIESAERYGMASLHQLRGRVGRAGQQGYCALFTSNNKPLNRLDFFAQTLDGQKLAELDLENRGAGDLFGTAQHGFSQLKYGNWTNLQLISKAQQLSPQLPEEWQPLIKPQIVSDSSPLAN
jgi:ATP-dependent DNA helicase RecG